MPALLTGYQVKRWSYASSVRETGFTVDRATIVYEETDPVTLLRQETIFNNATVDDYVECFMDVDGQRTQVFRGRPKDWGVDNEDASGRASSTLIAEDDRGKLLDTPVPPGMVCPGATFNTDGTITSGETMLSMIRKLCALVGITVDTTGAPDYVVGPDIAPAPGMTIGAAIARLLQPYQQVRRERLDFIYVGPGVYRLVQRPTTLSGGIAVPRSAVKLRRYRRSYVPPVAEAEVHGYAAAVPEAAAATEARAARQCTSNVAFEVTYPAAVQRISPQTTTFNWANFDPQARIVSDGSTTVTRLGDKVLSILVAGYLYNWIGQGTDATGKTIPIVLPVPSATWVEKEQTFTYDGQGRLKEVQATRKRASVVSGRDDQGKPVQPAASDIGIVSRVTNTINYDDAGTVIEEGTAIEELVDTDPSTGKTLSPKELRLIRVQTKRKTATAGGTWKEMEQWLLTAGVWEVDADAFEFSPARPTLAEELTAKWPNPTRGGAAATWSGGRWAYRDELMADAAAQGAIAAGAKAQGGQWLVEVELEMPVELLIRPHTVITFTGGSVVSITSFFVTEIDVSEDLPAKQRTLIVRGEAWVAGAAGASAGTLDTRGGIPTADWLRSTPKGDVIRLLVGVITAPGSAAGTVQVYIPEEGIVYPGIRSHVGLPPGVPGDRVLIERRGLTLWRAA